MIGRTLLHYEILDAIGAGGMGEVYLADDKKLKRKVALKVLPAEVSEDPDRLARFQREAEAIAALSHPNVVTIFSVEEAEGVHFLTMEWVDGKPLSEALGGGALDVDELLAIALPLTQALAAAHAKGIVHRDLKPQNVMLGRDGRVKVLDFGLAKFARQATAEPGAGVASELLTEAKTQEGVIVGTVPYLSPEQAQGGRADARSDVFSLGVMLYEMATGRRPFGGDSAIAILSAILKDDPPPVEGLPESLASILRRCLAKDPAERFQSGAEVHEALSAPRDTGKASTPSEVPSIAVRPFRTRANDDELASFAEGLVEDITAGLSRFSHLSVVSDPASSGGKERFAIEGALRRSGTNVRLNIKLLDVSTGAHLWAEPFDRDLASTDIFAAQDELTDRIVATIADTSGVLTRSLAALAKAKPIEDLTAHESVLRWASYWQHPRPDEHAEVRAALERVVKREPSHADAWACLCITCIDEHRFGHNPQPEPLDRALRAAERAVDLDPTRQLAQRALAEAHFYRRELSAFRPAAERVLALNPRDTASVAFMGHLFCFAEEWERGLPIVERVMELNPHHAGWLHFIFVCHHYRSREYEKALESAERVKIPGHVYTHAWLAAINAQLGRAEEARKQLGIAMDIAPEFLKNARAEMAKWSISEEFLDHYVEGLKKAGLELDEETATT